MNKNKTTKKTNKPGSALLKQALAIATDNINRIQRKGHGTKAAKMSKGNSKKRLSALDAAAKVLADSKKPMNARAIVKSMSDKGLWTSPGGKTPHATLHAAMSREIRTSGKDSRFKKADRGLFSVAK